jgi:hypothetical protein
MGDPPSISGTVEKQVIFEKDIPAESTILALRNVGDEPNVLEGADRNDVNHPQNWSPWKKRLLFLALMSSSVLTDG